MRKYLFEHKDEIRKYRHELNKHEQIWLDLFVLATSGANKSALAEIVVAERFANLRRQIVAEDGAKSRDAMNRVAPAKWSGDGQPYRWEDYIPCRLNEDALLDFIDARTHLKPRLGAPRKVEEIKVGDSVEVMLPKHIYDGHQGRVIAQRGDEFLVEIRSRYAPAGSGSRHRSEKIFGRLFVERPHLHKIAACCSIAEERSAS